MKNIDEHKKIAVLIDADNAQYSKAKLILDEISAHGHIIIKRAYGDWSSEYLKNWKNHLNELAIHPVQQFAYTSGKNSTDASMIIDAMDLLYTNKFDAFAIVSSDSDFTRLASRMKESEIFVFGVGQRKTPISFRNACDDFIYTENLGEVELKPDDEVPESQALREIGELVPIFVKAWKQHQNEDGWANISVVGGFVKRANPDFDPRSYGVTKFSEVLELLGKYFEIKKTKGKGTTNLIIFRLKTRA